MGAWGADTFDNDTACDWSYELEDSEDLSLVEAALREVRDVERDDVVDSDLGSEALAACEVIARLRGRWGKRDGTTETVDAWVKAHRIIPPAALVKLAVETIDRIAGEGSELAELWSESEEEAAWRNCVADLRQRVQGAQP